MFLLIHIFQKSNLHPWHYQCLVLLKYNYLNVFIERTKRIGCIGNLELVSVNLIVYNFFSPSCIFMFIFYVELQTCHILYTRGQQFRMVSMNDQLCLLYFEKYGFVDLFVLFTAIKTKIKSIKMMKLSKENFARYCSLIHKQINKYKQIHKCTHSVPGSKSVKWSAPCGSVVFLLLGNTACLENTNSDSARNVQFLI